MDMNVSFKIAAGVTGQQSVDALKTSLDKVGESATLVGKGTLSMVNSFGQLSNPIGMATAMMGKFAGVLGIAGAVAGLTSIVKGAIEAGAEMQHLSEKTGVSVESLSTLKQAAKLNNIELEDLGKGLQKFNLATSKAQTGNVELARAFSVVGISAATLKNSKPEDLFLKVSDGFAKMEDGAHKTRLAVDLFGKSGASMIPLLNMGSDAIEKMGVKMSSEFAERSKAFQQSMVIMEAKMKVFTISAVSDLMPTLQEIANAFLKTSNQKPDMVGFFDAVAEAARLLAVGLKTIWAGLSEVVDIAVTGTKQVKALATLNFDDLNRLADEYGKRSQQRANDLAAFNKSLLKNSLLFGEGTIDQIKKRQYDDTKPPERKGGAAPEIDALNSKLKSELEHIEKLRIATEAGMQAKMDELNAVNMSTVEYQKLTQARELDKKAAEMSVGWEEAGKKKLLETVEALKLKQAETIKAAYEISRTAQYGATSFFKDYAEMATNTASQVKNALSNAFKGAENALVDFVTTGKFNFKSLADSIIKDLIRISLQQSILGPLAGMMGNWVKSAFPGDGLAQNGTANYMPSANGNVFSGGNIQAFATGGVVGSPTTFPMANGGTGLMGEAGPEAIMPLKRGADGKLGVHANGMGMTNITVNVSTDGTVSTAGNTDQNGSRLGNAIAVAVRQEIIQQRRPGGLLSAV